MSRNHPPDGQGRSNKKKPEVRSPLFDELVFAPDRDQVPGARVVLSFDEGDDEDYLASIHATSVREVRLERRGLAHGSWAELDLQASGVDPRKLGADRELRRTRWDEARPCLLPGLAQAIAETVGAEGLELYQALKSPGGLATHLSASGLRETRELELSDERDLSKLGLLVPEEPWLKLSRLSTFEGDESLRLRVSFGEEVVDDAARDPERQACVRELAERVLPGAEQLGADPVLGELLEELLETRAELTQHIAYWNAPQGGALFHHDAFDEPIEGRQLGVLYVQLSGATAWLALSLEDLAQRVLEFTEALEAGEADWVRRALWPDRRDFERVLSRSRSRSALLEELASPGCGRFGPLVNQGPDFTSFLADAGHAFFVAAGDALLLPNWGLGRTAMHSVFCADEGPTYALSMGLRDASAATKG